MPVSFAPSFVEGKVYRGKKRTDEDDERLAILEIQTLLNAKGRKICDCEAQVHELLENCLNCGRLTCDSEGPGKCFHCGSLVLAQDQRDRLKKFIDISQSFTSHSQAQTIQSSSTTSTAQVRIIDNQYDQFSIDNQRHLTERDKERLKGNLSDLQSKRYQRKLVLDVDIDNMQAGSSSQPVIDYNDELRKLQVSEPITGSNSSNPTLVEILDKNASKKKEDRNCKTKKDS